MAKYLGINFYSEDTTHFCFLEKEGDKNLNYHFFTEDNVDWKSHVSFIVEKVNEYQVDKVFTRDFRWMPYPSGEISRSWKILCVLEYLLGEKMVPVGAYKLKSFARRKSRIKEFFEGDLIRKENKNFKLSWFYWDQEINQEELNALLLANYEDWKKQLDDEKEAELEKESQE